ncbi:hypothetical protein A33M_0423 [Rhodovulum sp. PH10]|nr:hypothetical protein A33M_0423 [Rhodovulum sp. PH10]
MPYRPAEPAGAGRGCAVPPLPSFDICQGVPGGAMVNRSLTG